MISRLTKERIKYLELLSMQYKTINSASTEIINLQAILNLPKGTEHFLSDVHGEHQLFRHVLKNGSGVVKNYIEEVFSDTLSIEEKNELAKIIYYPKKNLRDIKKMNNNLELWYKKLLFRMVEVCRRVASKYTRSKVRKALPSEFAYIMEELIQEDGTRYNKVDYYKEIIDTIISLNRADDFIIALANVIHRLAIDHLHLLGDIYDRGPNPHKILDLLMSYHSFDIQWGNHDVVWLGAAAGCEALICNAIRISARYNHLNTLQDGYGINLVSLIAFALKTYKKLPSKNFMPLSVNDKYEESVIAKVHKAISIIQFKLEGQLIKSRPEYKMDDRLLLDKIDYKKGTITINKEIYSLNDNDFPTINFDNPYELTEEEAELIKKLAYSFKKSDKLQQHAKLILNYGSMYLTYNSNLLFHACIPLDSDGNMKEIDIFEKPYKGKELLDKFESVVREGYYSFESDTSKKLSLDTMWYLWCGADSPLFGKDKMTTFERYFIDDEELWKEVKDPYFTYINEYDICIKILNEFGLNEKYGHIINGHMPVKVKNGECPVRALGKLLVIDGGFSAAYQKQTGIAGYTLRFNSTSLVLTAHQPYDSKIPLYANDLVSKTEIIEKFEKRIRVGDTDIGRNIKLRIDDLKDLVHCFNSGLIKEK